MTVELFQEDAYMKACHGVVHSTDEIRHCFSVDQTVFYPMGGGQPGDSGSAFYENDGDFEIIDTRRESDGAQIQHFVEPTSALPAIGTRLYLELDWQRRYRHMRVHSAMHLLCAIIQGRVTGGQVYDGRGRVDFDLNERLDKAQLTHNLNLMVGQNAPRTNLEVTHDELTRDKKLLDSLTVPPPNVDGTIRLVCFDGVDIQPCGGTHVRNTEEIGYVEVVKIENKGKHNRRISIILNDCD